MRRVLSLILCYMAMVPPALPLAPQSTVVVKHRGSVFTFTVIETVGASGSPSAITTHQGTASGNCSSATGITLTFATPTGANNSPSGTSEAIWVGWEQEQAPATTVTITDNKGNSYTKKWDVQTFLVHFGVGLAQLLVVPSGTSTITVTPAGSPTICAAVAMHVQRSSGSWTQDKISAATSSSVGGSPWASGTVTTTAANELLVGLVITVNGVGGCVDAPTGSWTAAYNQIFNGHTMMLSQQIVTTIQTNIANTGTVSTCTGPFGSAPGVVTLD